MRNNLSENDLYPEDKIKQDSAVYLCKKTKKQIEIQKNVAFFKVFICIVLVFLFFHVLPTYASQDASMVKYSIFPDTWNCPNKKCQRKNYEGIEYCYYCGTKRHRKIPGRSSERCAITRCHHADYELIDVSVDYYLDTITVLVFSNKHRKYNVYFCDILEHKKFSRYKLDTLIEKMDHTTLDVANRVYPDMKFTEENYGF